MKELLENRRFFKLVCGAGNESVEEVRRLVKLYSDAGCEVFDLSAKPEVVDAATAAKYKCVSVGIKGDPHVLKANINSKCINCGKCSKICFNDAIILNPARIDEKRCLGCSRCTEICPVNAIDLISKDADLKKVLPALLPYRIDCIELHATTEDEKETNEKWETINALFPGMLSICIDRLNLGNKQVIARIKRLIQNRAPYTTIIQADGIPMSGSDDSYKTTLQAVAMAEIIQNENLPVYIVLSGGTNTKTLKLAKLCGVNYHGIAVGSYARKIVKQYISSPDFWNNDKLYSKALNTAKSYLEETMENLNI